MSRLQLGRVDYINYIPVYHALEEGLVPLEADLVKGTPDRLNKLFVSGKLAATPISSIEYARHSENCLVLPDLSISVDGRSADILLFSKMPVTELEGKKISLTKSSASSATLLKILFVHYYQVEVEYRTDAPDLDKMMKKADGALLIGDSAMAAHQRVKDLKLPYYVTDLGEVWKQFTGEKFVFAIWVIQRSLAENNPDMAELICRTLRESKKISAGCRKDLISKAQARSGLPLRVIEDCYANLRLDFDESYRRALLAFYDYAYKGGLIEERVKLRLWGEVSE
ncbi:menaquinone biosynthetic enzyme MqnA/MqnD family protein [Pelotomaculum propionicicum]|uniref:menaquinone biosynthetic enzyme MqnA/MqnD family protein n=1 Tax=Pelotomaculum propionicicum TaxID=258475 RepID=UPI003B7635FA